MPEWDVIVVGGGNAACAAAVSARENGAKRVLCSRKRRATSAAATRISAARSSGSCSTTVEELDRFVPDAENEYPGFHAGVPVYPREAFREDLMRVTEGRSDPELADILIDELVRHDVLAAGRRQAQVRARALGDGRQGRQPDQVAARRDRAHRARRRRALRDLVQDGRATGVEIRYDSHVLELTQAERARERRRRARPDGIEDSTREAVVLACGGFETNPAWRTHYLGQEWGHAKVRGSNFNYGDGLKMALDLGAMPWGHWAAATRRRSSPTRRDYGKREMTDKTNRLSYLYGVMLNVEGRRWIDEGADFNASPTRSTADSSSSSPGGVVYQIFDSKVMDLLEPRYKTSEPFKSDTLEGLVKQLKVDHAQAMKTLDEYNEAAGTAGLQSRRARRRAHRRHRPAEDELGAEARHAALLGRTVTGGITFTFGGSRSTRTRR